MGRTSNKNKNKPEEQEQIEPSEETIVPTEEVSEVETAVQEDGSFKPVTLNFLHGFWCSELQKSFLPGYFRIDNEKEFNILSKYVVK